jgi:hypothetical protein
MPAGTLPTPAVRAIPIAHPAADAPLGEARVSVDNQASSEKMETMDEAKERPALPDHLSVDPRSPHHVAAVFEHEVGIRLNGKERHDVEEYCISEGWVKVPAGKTVDRKGHPLLIKLKGTVEAFYR